MTARRGTDAALLGFVLVAGAAVGAWLVLETRLVFFYQTLMPSSVMAACGRGLQEPVGLPDALLDFLVLRRGAFECALLDGVAGTGGLGAMARAHLYLVAPVIALWSAFGVSYASLWPLAAALHGAMAAAGFALGRLFLPRCAAVALGLVLAASPLATSVLALSIRDHAKAAFFLWALVLIVLALRARTGRRLVVLGAALGAVVGFGAGFRGDINVLLPVGLLVLTLGQWRGPVPVRARLAAAGTNLAVALALIVPLSSGAGGATGALWLQGATEPFRWHLRLPPPRYDLGERYSDELTYSAIGADLRRPDPAAWDAGEGRPGVQSAAQRMSSAYVAGFVHLFVGDVATRALKSVWLTGGLPTLLTLPRPPVVLYDVRYPANFTLSRMLAPWLSVLAVPWLPALGALGLLSVLWRSFGRSRREAAALGATLAFLLAVPSLQFALRHLFHLEALFWLGVLSLVTLPATLPAPRAHARDFGAWCAGLIFVALGSWAALRAWQDWALRREVQAMLAAPSEPVGGAPEPREGGRVLIRVSPPTDAAGLFGGPMDSLNPTINPLLTVRAAASRLLLEIGPDCPGDHVSLHLVYTKGPMAWQPMDRSLTVPRPPPGSSTTSIVVPAFWRFSQAFAGVELAAADRSCLAGIRRLQPTGPLPIIFSAVLAPGWERKRLSLGLSGNPGAPPPR